ncbi:hypothetical protein LTS07_001003 [Exophiala sideris]|uniref:Xylanolytic transcriptional activator regulatory domain-containing protein n=1 Tax=Exophiala sideris TaxID=1016849 RepID=A0ABR0JSB2_9EURO|nr:hypothetical protein LTS07_001003 [Exophiala sideris]KAK5043069.1 hypothetical protein LTR13_000840 [Exophiala sideris]KAK5068883.1 hypothetical protein LTR69_001004 [Exophiala sideris]KAK5186479.1 hypothetical protein LTR44_001535 [Eurotiomycetes sp. CCFEE 6388]
MNQEYLAYAGGQIPNQYPSETSCEGPSSGIDGAPNFMYTTFDDMDFNSNLDWILDVGNGEDISDQSGLLDFSGSCGNQPSQAGVISAPQTAPLAAEEQMSPMRGRHEQYSTDATALGGLLTPQPHETGEPGDPWPFEMPRPPQNHLSLPALGSDMETSRTFTKFFNMMVLNDRTWHSLQRCLMLPFEHNPRQTLSLDQFPSKEKLDHCLDLYFAYFHPMLAVLHQPTFDPGKDLVVTLAMVSIGACYSDITGAKQFSIALSELVKRLLVFMAEVDRRFVRTGSYLTAQLLQGTHGYCSGNERLFELSESCRSTLVHHAKCMGLFRYETNDQIQEDMSLEDSWYAWIDAERLRRLGWGVYKYDASVAYLHNNRPFLSTGDINLSLPASAEHWAAESAQSWAALHPWSKVFPPTPRLRPKIRLLFDGTPNAAEQITDEEHAFIVVLTLVRMVWSLKEIRSSPINDLVSPPIFDDGRQTLLNALDGMSVSIVTLSKTHTKTELDRLVHRMQLIHVAHIYGAGDLMNWLYAYLRHGPEAENASIRMRQWGQEDLGRTREVAYHCSQLLGLLRHYPNNVPLESFLIFHAGVVLSCVAVLLPTATNPDQSAGLHLDQLHLEDDRSTNLMTDWVNNGGDVQLSLSGVPSLCSPAGRQDVLDQTASLLKRRKVWGMARNLTKVVLSLATRDANTIAEDTAAFLPLSSTTLSCDSFPDGS